MAQRVRVRPGDCVSSIAFEHGFFTGTLWSHPENKALHDQRASPFVLEEGDEVFVPDVRLKEVQAATGRRHVFRRRGVPERLRLRLLDMDDAPRAGLRYLLRIDPGIEKRGSTDGDGWVIAFIPPGATRGVLELPDGESYELSLGHLEPADSIHGMQQRLHNLSYPCGEDAPGQLGPATWAALRAFVLAETGNPLNEDPGALPDAQDRLRRRHGC